MKKIQEAIGQIRETISSSCQKSGFDEKDIIIVAATKTVPSELIQEAIAAGITEIGENRVQEAESKFSRLSPEITRHMIGHLQKNKVKKALMLFDMIQSVDTPELARRIDTIAQELGKQIPVLLEINSSEESSKSGFNFENIQNTVESISQLENLRIEGLMTLGKYTFDHEEVRPLYREMRKFWELFKNNPFPRTKMKFLSMGMSHDYHVAVEEGANMVRLGTAIFGAREY